MLALSPLQLYAKDQHAAPIPLSTGRENKNACRSALRNTVCLIPTTIQSEPCPDTQFLRKASHKHIAEPAPNSSSSSKGLKAAKMGIASRESAIAIGFCFPIIGGILVAFRFYIRSHQKTSRQIDDWLCVPAWVCFESSHRKDRLVVDILTALPYWMLYLALDW